MDGLLIGIASPGKRRHAMPTVLVKRFPRKEVSGDLLGSCKEMEAVAYQASEEGGSLPRGLKSLRENSALSPEGTSESSPGR
jgi:hypothetical protein